MAAPAETVPVGRETELKFAALKGVCLPQVISQDGRELGFADVRERVEYLSGKGYIFWTTRGLAHGKDGRQGVGLNILAEKRAESGLERELVYSVEIDGDGGVSAAEYEDLMAFVELFRKSLGEQAAKKIAETAYKKVRQGLDRQREKRETGSGSVKLGRLEGLARSGGRALAQLSDRLPTANRGVLGSVTGSLRRALESLLADRAQMGLTAEYVDLMMAALRRHFSDHLTGLDADSGMEELGQFAERALLMSVKREELEASAQNFRTNHDLQVEFLKVFRRLANQRGVEPPDPIKLMQLFVVYGTVTGQPQERMTAVMTAYTKLNADETARVSATRNHRQQLAMTQWNGASQLVTTVGGGLKGLLATAIGEVVVNEDGKVESSSGLVGVANTALTVTLPGTLRGLFGAVVGNVGKEATEGTAGRDPEGLVGVIVFTPWAIGKGIGGGMRYFWNESGLSLISEDTWRQIIKYASLTGSMASLTATIATAAVGLPVVVPVVLGATTVGGLTTAVINYLDSRRHGTGDDDEEVEVAAHQSVRPASIADTKAAARSADAMTRPSSAGLPSGVTRPVMPGTRPSSLPLGGGLPPVARPSGQPGLGGEDKE